MNPRETPPPDYLPRGVAPAAAAALLWGTADLWRKEVMRSVDPFWVAVVSGVLVCAAMWRPGAGYRGVIATYRADRLASFAISILGITIGLTLFFWANHLLPISTLTLLETLQPIVVLALARIFLGERLERGKIPYVILSICAAYAIGFSGVAEIEFNQTYLLGLLCLVGGMLGNAASLIGGRQLSLKGVSATQTTLTTFSLGTAALIPIALASSSPSHLAYLSASDYTYLILAAAGMGLGYLLHYVSLKTLPATISGFFDLLIPVTGVTLGVLCLDESLTTLQWAAIPFLLWSVFRISL